MAQTITDTPVKTDKKRLVIDPITRLEGHGKIDIFLDDTGNVKHAYYQVPELRGFERFCVGRHVSELPIITNRLCGVCPAAHHLAGARAVDAVFDAEPTETAHMLRELFYHGQYLHSHTAHFYALAAADFVLGPAAPKASRNVLGVVEEVGLELGGAVIKARSFGQRIQEIIGGRATHPCFGIPGGVSRPINEEQRAEIQEMGEFALEFGKTTQQIFKDVVLSNEKYMEIILNPDIYYHETYYMGLVDKDDKMNFYRGDVKIVDQDRKEVARFQPADYLDYIAEHVEQNTYMKMPHFKKVGWNGLKDGKDSGIYRVGPLGRGNVATGGFTTPLAQEQAKFMWDTLGSLGVEGSAHHTMAFHWIRTIELLHSCERILELINDPKIMSTDVRGEVGPPGEGVGIVEAPRGTLIHHYAADKDGLTTMINMIVATTNNNAAITLSVAKAAKALIKDGMVSDGLLNMVEMAFRCYDPCNSCGTHALTGQRLLDVDVIDSNGKVVHNENNLD